MIMRHLAHSGDIPAILVVAGVADGAHDHSARIPRFDRLQTVGAFVFLGPGQADLGVAPRPLEEPQDTANAIAGG